MGRGEESRGGSDARRRLTGAEQRERGEGVIEIQIDKRRRTRNTERGRGRGAGTLSSRRTGATPKKGRLAEPGRCAQAPGKGAIMAAPVSVCQ